MGTTVSNTGYATSNGGEIQIQVSELYTDTPSNVSHVQVTGTIINSNATQTASDTTISIPCSMSGTDELSNAYSYTGTPFMIGNLRPGGSKQFIQQTFVVPHDTDGTGSCSFTVRYGETGTTIFGHAASIAVSLTLTTIATQSDAPGAPSFSEILPTSVVLQWTPPSNDGGAAITSYRVLQYKGDDTTTPATTLQAGLNQVLVVTNLEAGTDYTFTVAAFNGAGPDGGYSPESSPATMTTLAGAWMRVDGVWVAATPYVRVDGVWKMAVPYVRIGGVWKPTH